MSSTASAARIAANEANGLKSTGPRTAEGKARVSENALKHGLRSERNPLDLATDTALPIERAEFETTLAVFMDEFAPASPFETRLVQRLAQIDLRLQRAVRMETAHLDISARRVFESMGKNLPTDEPRTHDSWLVTLAFLHNPAALKLIGQYESRLARDSARTLSQLRQAQRVQRAGPLVGKSQERAPLSAVEEKPREQTQAAGAALIPEQSAASDRVVRGPETHSNPDSSAANPTENAQTNPIPRRQSTNSGTPTHSSEPAPLQPIAKTPHETALSAT